MYVPLTGSIYAENGAMITQEFVDKAISKIEKILEEAHGKHNVPGQWKKAFADGRVEDLRQYLFPQNGNAEVLFYYLLGCFDKNYFITETHIIGDDTLCGSSGNLTSGLEEVFAELGMEVCFGIAREEPLTLSDD